MVFLMIPILGLSQVQVGPSFGFDMQMERVIPNGESGYYVDKRIAPVGKVGVALKIEGVVLTTAYNWEDKIISFQSSVFFPVNKGRRRGKCYKF